MFNPHNSNKCIHLRRMYFERLWMVYPKNETQELKEGEMIKIGRVRLKIDKVSNIVNYTYINLDIFKV